MLLHRPPEGRRSWSVEEAMHSHLGQFLTIRECRYTSQLYPKGAREVARFTDVIVFCVAADPCHPFLDSPLSSASQMPYEYKLASYKYSLPLTAGCVTDLDPWWHTVD